MNLIKKIKRFWKIANKDHKVIDEFMKLTDKEIAEIPDEDQKGTFISEGTIEEYKEFENEKKFGTKKIFDV